MTAGVAVGAIALYFSNQITIKYLDERKEWLTALAVERREWNDKLERLSDRYDTRLAAAIEAMQAMRDQMHSLRGDLQKAISGIETRLVELGSRLRGGNSD